MKNNEFSWKYIKGIKGVPVIKRVDGDFYISVTYTCENEEREYELTFPNILLPLCNAPREIKVETNYFMNIPNDNVEIDLGFGKLPIDNYHRGPKKWWYTKIIREKTKKMTLSEVEAALGHKVELVSEK